MRISDWSSDVCSSDLSRGRSDEHLGIPPLRKVSMLVDGGKLPDWQAVIFIPQDVSVFFWIDSTSTQIHLQKLVDGLPDASYSARMTMAVEIGRTKFPDRTMATAALRSEKHTF